MISNNKKARERKREAARAINNQTLEALIEMGDCVCCNSKEPYSCGCDRCEEKAGYWQARELFNRAKQWDKDELAAFFERFEEGRLHIL